MKTNDERHPLKPLLLQIQKLKKGKVRGRRGECKEAVSVSPGVGETHLSEI